MRRYLESHPWITFKATDINNLGPKVWMLLGEARSKCEHLAGTPLRPSVARRLRRIALVRGAQATTAIEGNTLTEEQVAGILDGTFRAPPSREYQEREVRNVLDALRSISGAVLSTDASTGITADLICGFNGQLLEGTEHESHVVPGEVRSYPVVVSAYRGAPAEDCEYLLERLATWLESDTFQSDDAETGFALTVARAVYAHLYISWIHPFGDGNGRTARLLEFLILARSGVVPLLAANLLSNHYNLTRDRYYRELAQSSRTGETASFLAYAMQGLVDGIRDQIENVRRQQLEVTWASFVNNTLSRHPSSPARDRQRALVLAIPLGATVSRDQLPGASLEVAVLYAKTGPRTLSRDLNRLKDDQLLVRTSEGWMANHAVVEAFRPNIADNDHPS